MLTEEQLEIVPEKIVSLFNELEISIIEDVVKRIKETLTYTRTSEIQVLALQELGYSPAKIRNEVMKNLRANKEFEKLVAENTAKHRKKVKKMVQDIMKRVYEETENTMSKAGMASWQNDLRIWNAAGKELQDNSFLKQLIEAFTLQTNGELENLTRTTGFKTMNGLESLESTYRKELDKGVLKICSGTYTIDKVVEETVYNLSKSGLRYINFASGHSMQLDTASRLALRTGCHQLSGKILDKNMERSGENLVYVSKHWGARNKAAGHANHEQWQGKVYYIRKGTDYSREAERVGQKNITDLWEATGYSADGTKENDPLGLYGYNCRHLHHVWFEGVSNLPNYDPEPASVAVDGKNYDYYAATQKMRYMERCIRALKREREALGKLGMDTIKVQAQISKKISEYHQFCKNVGLKAKDNRLKYEAGASASSNKKVF